MAKSRSRYDKKPKLDLSAYLGQWIAIDPQTKAIVSHGKSCQQAEKAAKSVGVSRPLMLPVPKSPALFVGKH
ncbi:MAG: hypothetical protein FJ271_03045 [Planctomycetes bacterium]|nr:hypothetical protein [Planctomycetota bacterium]